MSRGASLRPPGLPLKSGGVLSLRGLCSLAGRQPSRMARGLRVLEQPQPWVVICDMGTPGLGLMGQAGIEGAAQPLAGLTVSAVLSFLLTGHPGPLQGDPRC